MKVELKYLMLANSNDAIFKTDLASLKCNASSFKMSRFFTEKVASEYRRLSSLAAGGTSAAIPAILQQTVKNKYKELNIIRIN